MVCLCQSLGSCFKSAVMGMGGVSLRESELETFSGLFSLQAIVAGAGAIVHEKHRGKLSVSLGVLCPLLFCFSLLFFCLLPFGS